jgi:CO/xanthine dehydrogenase FAD-binding subunit
MQLLRPRSAKEALREYTKHPDALPLAGGTDFMVMWNMGLLNDRKALDLSEVREWAGIRKEAKSIRIGSLATHTRIQEHPEVRRHLPLLAQACGTIGSRQIQNRGTLGGNIANASPAGDTFPALAVYEATVRTISPRGHRDYPFNEVFTGVKKTAFGSSELIESIDMPIPPRTNRRMFRKIGTRAAQAISKIVAAGMLWLRRDKSVRKLRFALGSVAPTIRRLTHVEDFIRGRRIAGAVVKNACALLERDISPIDDIRSTRLYRLEVSRNLLRSFLLNR